MHTTTWRRARTISTNHDHRLSFVSCSPAAFTAGRTESRIAPSSSGGKRLATSPDVSMPLMSSKKLFSITCVSLNRNTVWCWSTPAIVYSFFRSSRKRSDL